MLATALPASPVTDRCYELRIYTAGPGKLSNLHARFRNHTLRLFEKHGMTSVGYWVPVENPENKLIYLLSYPSRAARDESWKNFRADPAWQAAKTASEVDGPLAIAVEEHFLQATDFSPEIVPSVRSVRRVFEMRTYHATPENLGRLVARSRDNTDWLFNLYGVTNIGTFTVEPPQAGSKDSLIYLLAHQSLESGEEAFKKIKADRDWATIKERSEEEAGGPLVQPSGVESIYLEATDYSPTK
jgi:hypothetical protein